MLPLVRRASWGASVEAPNLTWTAGNNNVASTAIVKLGITLAIALQSIA
jgi:hypothetical protein